MLMIPCIHIIGAKASSLFTISQLQYHSDSPLELKSALADERESSSWQELQTLSGLEDWAGSDTRLEEQPLHTTNPHFLYTTE